VCVQYRCNDCKVVYLILEVKSWKVHTTYGTLVHLTYSTCSVKGIFEDPTSKPEPDPSHKSGDDVVTMTFFVLCTTVVGSYY